MGDFIMIKYFEQIKKFPDCITFTPCAESEISKASSLLAASGFCALPEEYKEFLKLSDGLSYNGLEFFGIQNHNRTLKKYTFPDIAASTFHYKGYAFFKRKLVIGRISEALICYDKNSDDYIIVDRVSLRPLNGGKTLADLFKIFLNIFALSNNNKNIDNNNVTQ